jgi:hypothetical protein
MENLIPNRWQAALIEMAAAARAAVATLRNVGRFSFRKTKRNKMFASVRDPKYLDWIRRQPCLLCGGPSEAAHTGPHGYGQKASDHDAIPLCWRHHRWEGDKLSYHQLGKRFWDTHLLDRKEVLSALRERYAERES